MTHVDEVGLAVALSMEIAMLQPADEKAEEPDDASDESDEVVD